MDKFAHQLINSGQTSIANYLIDNYTKIGMTSDELIIYLQFKRYFDYGIIAPDIDDIIAKTDFDQQRIYQILHQLIQKKLMTIKTAQDKQGKDFDQYRFDLMYDKLADLYAQGTGDEELHNSGENRVQVAKSIAPSTNARKHVFESIEREFGRELSPIELETISQWLDTDGYHPEMVELALRESVLNQVYNLKYIDRILLNWHKKNIKTPNDVEKEISRYEKQRTPQTPPDDDGPDIPMFKIK